MFSLQTSEVRLQGTEKWGGRLPKKEEKQGELARHVIERLCLDYHKSFFKTNKEI
jgi:hypothetical protein